MNWATLPFINQGSLWVSERVHHLERKRVSIEIAIVAAPILTTVGLLWKPDWAARILSKMAVSAVDKISSLQRPLSDCLKIAVPASGLYMFLSLVFPGSLMEKKQRLSSFSRITNLAVGYFSFYYALVKGGTRGQLILGGTHHSFSGEIILAAGIALSSLGIFLRDILVKDPGCKFNYYWNRPGEVRHFDWKRMSAETGVVAAPILATAGLLWKSNWAARILSKMALSTVDKISSLQRPFSDCLKIAVPFSGVYVILSIVSSRFWLGKNQALSSFSRIANLAVGCFSLYYALVKGNARGQLILGGTHHFFSRRIILAAGIALSSLGIFLRDVLVKDPDSKFDYYWEKMVAPTDPKCCAHAAEKLTILAPTCLVSERLEERDIKGFYKRALQQEQREEFLFAFNSYLKVFEIARQHVPHLLPIVRGKMDQCAKQSVPVGGLRDLTISTDQIPALVCDLVQDRSVGNEALIPELLEVMPPPGTPLVHTEIAKQYQLGRIAEGKADRATGLLEAFACYYGCEEAEGRPLILQRVLDKRSTVVKELLEVGTIPLDSLGGLGPIFEKFPTTKPSSSPFLFDWQVGMTHASKTHKDLLVGFCLEALAAADTDPKFDLPPSWQEALNKTFVVPDVLSRVPVVSQKIGGLRTLFAAFLHLRRALEVSTQENFPIKENISRSLRRIIRGWVSSLKTLSDSSLPGSLGFPEYKFLMEIIRDEVGGKLNFSRLEDHLLYVQIAEPSEVQEHVLAITNLLR